MIPISGRILIGRCVGGREEGAEMVVGVGHYRRVGWEVGQHNYCSTSQLRLMRVDEGSQLANEVLSVILKLLPF